MKKAIVFTALAFSAATLSAQYNIDLSAESVAALKANAVNTIAFFMIDM